MEVELGMGLTRHVDSQQLFHTLHQNEILGKLIVDHFSRVDSFTSKDENANFFKELKGMSSWRKFAQAVGLICVWKTHHEYEMIYNVRNSDNSFSPDGKHCSHLSICSSEELIGAKAKRINGFTAGRH